MPSGAIWSHLELYGAIWNLLEPSNDIWTHLRVVREDVTVCYWGLIWFDPMRLDVTWCVRFDFSWCVLSFEFMELDVILFHSMWVGLMIICWIHCDLVAFDSSWSGSSWLDLVLVGPSSFDAGSSPLDFGIWFELVLFKLFQIALVCFYLVWAGFIQCGSIESDSMFFYLVRIHL